MKSNIIKRGLLGFTALVAVFAFTGMGQGLARAAESIGPVVDAKVVKNQKVASTTIKTPVIVTNYTNELIVVTVSADGAEDVYNNPQSVTSVTGCGINWRVSEARQANGMPGVAAYFYAKTTKVLRGCRVTVTLAQPAQGQVTVTSFVNGEMGDNVGGIGSYGTIETNLYVLNPNSRAFMVGHNWTRAAGVVAGAKFATPSGLVNAPTTVDDLYLSSNGDTNWVQSTGVLDYYNGFLQQTARSAEARQGDRLNAVGYVVYERQ